MKTSITGLALLALAASANALETDRLIERDFERDIERSVQIALSDMPVRIALGDQALSFAGRELESERVVKGAPYCATAVHENVQTLGDGNRIVRKQQSQLCRDGEGRTRREVQREGGPKVIYLNDPVAKESWVVYPDQKRVQRLRSNAAWAPGADAAAHAAWEASMQDWGERMKEQAARWKEWGGRVAERARSVDAERVRARAMAGEPGIVIEQELMTTPAPGASAVERRRELRVIRASEMPAPPAMPAPPTPLMVPTPPVPPMPLLLPGPMLPREGGTTTVLAPKEIDGLKVTGERTSWTIEAGKIGNEKPIVSTREVWRSPELMLTVMSRDADPRMGEQNYRLEKVKRGEPDAALMKPPAEFSESPRRSAKPASAPSRAS
ncbi:hypothetical protein [Pelomonas sp. Root1217]|uniref:hypothetical protein n=1 Tax=Pelomonas sp. Root1217 TaxID=1736430 RepID=UPI000AD13490|nr:hypothetical protein [Pelomonas sp. Root1217]